MYASAALRQDLSCEGNELLRATIRAFYDPEDSIVVGGLTQLSYDTETWIYDTELSSHLHLTSSYVNARLAQFHTAHILIAEEVSQKSHNIRVVPRVGGAVSVEDAISRSLPPEEQLNAVLYAYEYHNHYDIQAAKKDDPTASITTFTLEKLRAMPLAWLIEHLPTKYTDIRHDRSPEGKQIRHFTCYDRDKTNRQKKSIFLAEIRENMQTIKNHRYRINFEALVYVIKWKMQQIQERYKKLSDPEFFFCPNRTCRHFNDFIPAAEVYQKLSSRGAAGANPMGSGTSNMVMNMGGGTSSSQLMQLGTSNSNTRPRIGLGGAGAANPLVQLGSNANPTNTPSALAMLNQKQAQSMLGTNISGVKRPNANMKSYQSSIQYPCPNEECATMLKMAGSHEVSEEKRLFLAQMSQLSDLSQNVFNILKQIRDYEDEQSREELALLLEQSPHLASTTTTSPSTTTATNGKSSNPSANAKKSALHSKLPKTAGGAVGGCSTAEELASRVEVLKDPLPWDELSTADQDRLKFAQLKQAQLSEELERKRVQQEREQAREKQMLDVMEEERKERQAMELKIKIFGPPPSFSSSSGLSHASKLQSFHLPQNQSSNVHAHANAHVNAHDNAHTNGKLDDIDESTSTLTSSLALSLTQQQQQQQQQQQLQIKNSSVQPETIDSDGNEICWVSAGGERIRFQDVDESALDLMNDDEFNRYVILANGE